MRVPSLAGRDHVSGSHTARRGMVVPHEGSPTSVGREITLRVRAETTRDGVVCGGTLDGFLHSYPSRSC